VNLPGIHFLYCTHRQQISCQKKRCIEAQWPFSTILVATVRIAKLARRAAPARPESEPAAMQIVEICPDDGEQPPKMSLAARRIAMKLNLRRLRFHQTANFQARFIDRRKRAKEIGVAAELDLVTDLQRRAAFRRRLEVDNHGSGSFRQDQV